MKRKICFVTGTRAEYGLLSELIRKVAKDADLQLQIIATNMHLSPEFGLTYKEIESDGFTINKKVEMLLSSDTANATVKSIGLGIIGFADAIEDLKPDLIVILGDRYEMLVVATTALIYKIPVAHLHGGEITEGAYDNAIRHAITKLSHLHFTSTETYRNRVIQMGEQPSKVFNVGALGVENAKHTPLLSKNDLESSINFELGDKSLLVTFHPVTMENSTARIQFENLLSALDLYNNYKIIFTLPNSDTDGRIILQLIDEYVSANKNRSIAFQSLGKIRYLSALKYVTAVVGNSSSGIVEVPSFGKPVLNIGNRQKGRITAKSVVNCEPEIEDINAGLQKILSDDFLEFSRNVSNPYEKEGTSNAIFDIIKNYPLKELIQKSFNDIK